MNKTTALILILIMALGISACFAVHFYSESNIASQALAEKTVEADNQAAEFLAAIQDYKIQIAELTPDYESWQAEVDYWRLKAALNGSGGLRLFDSPEELETWLEQDPTNEGIYTWNDHDCEDFSLELVEAAAADGFWMGLYLVPGDMSCFTIIGDSIYRVFPTLDKAVYLSPLDKEWNPWGWVDLPERY